MLASTYEDCQLQSWVHYGEVKESAEDESGSEVAQTGTDYKLWD